MSRAGIRFVRSCAIDGDPGPGPLRYASVNGRQLFALVSAWPELARDDRLTGIYHAAGGREKAQIKGMGRDLVVRHGFDVLKPAAMIFEHVPFGPLAQLAITLGCKGPFWSIEADELAGPTATLQALEDLAEGRCDQAIVAGFDFEPPAARVFLLVRDEAADLAWHARFTHGGTGAEAGFGTGTDTGVGTGTNAGVGTGADAGVGTGADAGVGTGADARARIGADARARTGAGRGPGPGPDAADLATIGAELGGPVMVLADETGDHHGLGLVCRAFDLAPGQVAAIWRQAPDGRGMLLGVRSGPC